MSETRAPISATEVAAARALVASLQGQALDRLDKLELFEAVTNRLRAQVRLARATQSARDLQIGYELWIHSSARRTGYFDERDTITQAQIELLRAGLELAELAGELDLPDLARKIRARTSSLLTSAPRTAAEQMEVEIALDEGELALRLGEWELAVNMFIGAEIKLDGLMGVSSAHVLRIALGRARVARAQHQFDDAEQHYLRAARR